jgi:hypothetical protein
MAKENNKSLVGEKNIEAVCSNYSRYNGGWLKTITDLNKEKTNGYSLVGSFINTPAWLPHNSLILDCSIDGSRKNQKKSYHLLEVTKSGELAEIFSIQNSGNDWAIKLWDTIEKFLGTEKGTNQLEGYSDEELLAEIKRRNIAIS